MTTRGGGQTAGCKRRHTDTTAATSLFLTPPPLPSPASAAQLDLFCKRLHKLIDIFTTIYQFSSLEQHTHIEGLEQMLKHLNNIIDDVKRKPYDLLDYTKNAFDRDFLEFNVNINDLELQLQVREWGWGRGAGGVSFGAGGQRGLGGRGGGGGSPAMCVCGRPKGRLCGVGWSAPARDTCPPAASGPRPCLLVHATPCSRAPHPCSALTRTHTQTTAHTPRRPPAHPHHPTTRRAL